MTLHAPKPLAVHTKQKLSDPNKGLKRFSGKCLYRIREIQSPIGKTFRGFRIEVATPNLAARKPWSDEWIPSFDRPYFICRFGDYEDFAHLLGRWEIVERQIRRMGFTEIVQYKTKSGN